MSFADIGVDPSDVGEVKELWTGEVLHPSQEGISYNVPVCDARIFRIEKKGHPDGIVELSRPSDEGGATAFDLLGRRIPYSAVGSPTQGARRLYVLKQGNCVRKCSNDRLIVVLYMCHDIRNRWNDILMLGCW